MKSILKISFILMVLISISKATPQIPDLIIIDGDTLALYSLPLESYFETKNFNHELFKKYGTSTACNRNYIAVWEVKNDSLFLTQLKSCNSDSVLIPHSLIFSNISKKTKIFASWVNNTIWAEIGNKIHYEHIGFGWYYDKELEMEIIEGKVSKIINHDYTSKTYLSEIFKDGFSLKKYVCQNANWEILDLEGGEVKVIVVHDADTTFVIKASESSNQSFENESLRIVNSIKPSKLFQFGVPIKFRFSFPIFFSEEIKQLCIR